MADQYVYAFDGIRPGVGHLAERGPLTDSAFFSNYVYNAFQFPTHALVRFDHRIKCVRDLARYTDPTLRETRGKIAALERHQCREQLTGVEVSAVRWRAISSSRCRNSGSFFHGMVL